MKAVLGSLALVAILVISPHRIQGQAPAADKARQEQLQRLKAQLEAAEKDREALKAQLKELQERLLKAEEQRERALDAERKAQAEALRKRQQAEAELQQAQTDAERAKRLAEVKALEDARLVDAEDVQKRLDELNAGYVKALAELERMRAAQQNQLAAIEDKMKQLTAQHESYKTALLSKLKAQPAGREKGGQPSLDQKLDQLLERLQRIERRLDALEKSKARPEPRRGKEAPSRFFDRRPDPPPDKP
jgi:chromosome segregation ATPase